MCFSPALDFQVRSAHSSRFSSQLSCWAEAHGSCRHPPMSLLCSRVVCSTQELIKRIWGINFNGVGILCKSLFPSYLQKSVAGCTLQCSGVNNMNLFHVRSSSVVIKQDDV